MALADLVLQSLQRVIGKFDNAPAGGAHQMVMVLVSPDMFKVSPPGADAGPPAQGYLAHQARLHQEFQRAVDGGPRDPVFTFLQPEQKLFGFKMIVSGKDLIQNRLALGGQAQAPLGQVLAE